MIADDDAIDETENRIEDECVKIIALHQPVRMDDQLDRYCAEIVLELVDTMKKSPNLIVAALSLFLATRYLDRIADHAINIAEDVIYIAEGKIVRHHPECLENPRRS